MTSHDRYLDELLHNAWVPLPPAEIEDAVVLQCHRDDGRRRFYFRVTLTDCAVRGFDDPDELAGMKVMGVAINERQLCLEGIQGGELRLSLPGAIKHISMGSVEDSRSWTSRLGLGADEAPAAAVDVVPVDGGANSPSDDQSA